MATVLYTPEVLNLAMVLFEHPLDDAVPLRAGARSKSCGSTLELGLALDDRGRIERVGLRCQACAIGQASAAIFAQHALGHDAATIRLTAQAMRGWLEGERDLPAWPGLDAIAAAREYPARHGAVMLVWDAALAILG